LKLYIYTIPKAGTYFLAGLIGKMGYHNTGYHINASDYLDTLSFDVDVNREHPHATTRNISFLTALKSLQDRQLAFGHFPAPALPAALPEYKFVCAYRHPMKTLVSEFVDFRFRRRDVEWITPQAIPNDHLAFETYLKRHSPAQERIFAHMLSVLMSVNEPSCVPFEPARYHFLNFDKLLENPEKSLPALADFLEFDRNGLSDLFADALETETKTKATSIELDRASLWTAEAKQIYASRPFEAIVNRGVQFGWDLEQPSGTRLIAAWRMRCLQFTNRLRLVSFDR